MGLGNVLVAKPIGGDFYKKNSESWRNLTSSAGIISVVLLSAMAAAAFMRWTCTDPELCWRQS